MRQMEGDRWSCTAWWYLGSFSINDEANMNVDDSVFPARG